ncbi:MAG: hypothetical protein HQM10_26360 [Candidatus Riflebacteria bacterium]|nr:hypothetical protein [Candidatus Riflebacteria bacterium]
MRKVELLKNRIYEIGEILRQSNKALALLALGSIGKEVERLDEYSDLDFFVITKQNEKRHFLNSLEWLNSIKPIVFCYQNTVDGFKLLFDDAVFCEFAIFEVSELLNIPFSEGRIIWKSEGFDENICKPRKSNIDQKPSKEWLIGEVLTNIYVGLCRYKRGEKLAGSRMIQYHAVDKILELTEFIEIGDNKHRDSFSNDRRFEMRHKTVGGFLPDFMQGYNKSCESAKAILKFLEKYFEINKAMKNSILSLSEVDEKSA